MRKWLIRLLGGLVPEDMPKPAPKTLRKQCGEAVVEVMIRKDIKFSKMMKIGEMSADKLWWYLIGDRRGSPGKDMDVLEAIAPALGSEWIGPKFVFPEDESLEGKAVSSAHVFKHKKV